MGVIVTIRENAGISLFKGFFYAIFDKYPQIDEVLICSGYYQERYMGSLYEAVREPYNGQTIADLLRDIPRVTLIGIRDPNGPNPVSNWHQSYKDFVEDLRTDVNDPHGDRIKAYYDNQGNWHAKEFIALSRGQAVAGIIGSSNFTAPAFGVAGINGFNIEADTVLYDSSGEDEMAAAVEVARANGGDDTFIIAVPSNPNRPEDVRVLDQQYRKIMQMLQNPGQFVSF